MNLRFRQILTGALCALTLVAVAPAAHAAPQAVAAFRAGNIVGAKLNRGNEQAAQQVIAPFVNTIHVLFVDNQAQTAAWVILTADGKSAVAVCDKLGWNEEKQTLSLAGQVKAGPAAGTPLSGIVLQGQDGKLYVAMQIQTSSVDVVFAQELEPLKIEQSSGG